MLSIIIAATSILVTLATLLLSKKWFAMLIVIVSLSANFVSFLVYYLAPDLSRVAVIIATREVLVDLSFVLFFGMVLLLTLLGDQLIDKVYFLLLVIFIGMIVSSRQPIVSVVVGGRELIFPIAVFFIFRCLNLDQSTIRSVLKLIVSMGLVVAILSVVEQIYTNMINTNFWTSIEVNGYLSQKYGGFRQPYPQSWINYLPVFIGLPPTFRSIGLMLDPLVTGHFLAGVFTIILYAARGVRKYVLLAIVGLGVLGTFSKAAVLICFIAVGLKALSVGNRYLKRLALIAVCLTVIVATALLLRTGDDAFTHYGAFRTGITMLTRNVWGFGVGSTGYFNYLVTGMGAIEAVDTTFSVYVFQMGVIGLFALGLLTLIPLIVVLRDLRHSSRPQQGVPLAMICLALMSAYTILAFASSAAFTAVPVLVPMMLLGMYTARQSPKISVALRGSVLVVSREAQFI